MDDQPPDQATQNELEPIPIEPILNDDQEFNYPEAIHFHLPGLDTPTVLRHDEDRLLHRQLVCWCMIQRYRYYVLNQPVVSDMEYDVVEKTVLAMRNGADYLKDLYCPLTEVGSNNERDYPLFIRSAFSLPGNKPAEK